MYSKSAKISWLIALVCAVIFLIASLLLYLPSEAIFDGFDIRNDANDEELFFSERFVQIANIVSQFFSVVGVVAGVYFSHRDLNQKIEDLRRNS